MTLEASSRPGSRLRGRDSASNGDELDADLVAALRFACIGRVVRVEKATVSRVDTQAQGMARRAAARATRLSVDLDSRMAGVARRTRDRAYNSALDARV